MATADPGRARWTPDSEADIQAAIDAGMLTETHYFDVKREVGTTPGERKNIARHAASLGPDGGALLIGVEELKDERSWRLAPQPLNGLAEQVEQVEQITGQLVDPPLFVSTTDISSTADPSTGYLVVNVPPSATAPHMVDGIHYGRGDRTRTRLSDAEVLRLHTRREPVERIAHQVLDEEIARDYVPDDNRGGHLFAVAQPLTGRRDLARPLVAGRANSLLQLFNAAENVLDDRLRQWSPRPDNANSYSRRARGAAMCSFAASGPGRTVNPQSDGGTLLDLEVREDGGLRLLMGRMTTEWARRDQSPMVIADGLAVAYAVRLARWAAEVGTRTGYHGTWVLGLHADHMRGLISSIFWDDDFAFNMYDGVAYDAPNYREVTTASHMELLEQPRVVAERLVGAPLRGLGTESHYGPSLSSPPAGSTSSS